MTTEIVFNQSPILINTSQNHFVLEALASLNHIKPICVTDHDHMTDDWRGTQARLVIVDSVVLCAQIRSEIPVPILVISDDVEGALAAGANDCVPMNQQLLGLRVQSLLRDQSHIIYDAMPAMISIIDADDKLVYANEMWLTQLGYDWADVIGIPLGDIMSEISRMVLPRILHSFREMNVFHTVAFRYTKKDGTGYNVLSDSMPLSDGQILTVIRDITELQAAEKSLRSSRNELISIMRALPDTVLVTDYDGTILDIISEEKDLPFFNFDHMLDRPIFELLSKDTGQRLREMFKYVSDDDSVQTLDFNIEDEGQVYYLQLTISPVDADEIVLVIRDFSRQRRAETTLIQSEKNYRRLFENATDAIFVIDVMTGKILQASPQASLVLGYSIGELLTMQIDEIESDQIAIHDQPEIDIFNTDKLTVETQYRRKNNSLIDVEITSRVIFQNQQLILISFVRDISERKRNLAEVERQRNIAQALLETANKLNETNDLHEVLTTILDNIHRVMPCDSTNVMLIDDNQARIICQVGYHNIGFTKEEIENITLPLNKASNLDWIVEHKRSLRVKDTNNSEYFNWVDPTTAHDIKSILTAPIIRDTDVVGFINLDSTKIDTFSQEQEMQVMAFANQAAIALQRSDMFQKLHAYTDLLEERVDERTREIRNANTDLEQIQSQLATERNLLRNIIDNIPDSVYVKDTDHRFMIANQSAIQGMEGIETEADLVGKTDTDLYPKQAARLMREEKRIMTTRIPQLKQSEIFHHEDGSNIHLLVSKVPMIDANGNVSGIIGLNQDITQLREAETRLEQVINSARCLLWSATVTVSDNEESNQTWQYQVVNEDAAREFLPLNSVQESYTKAWINGISDIDHINRKNRFREAITDHNLTYRMEYQLHQSETASYWLSEDVLIERISETLYSVIGVCTDITNRKAIEEQLTDLNEELELRVATRTLELSKTNTQLINQIYETEKAETAEREQRIIAEALRDGIAQLATTHDRDIIFDRMLTLMKTIIPHDAASIWLVDGDSIHIVHSQGFDAENIGLRFKIEDMPDVRFMLREKVPHIINDTGIYAHWQDDDTANWVKSTMSIPITITNEVIGFISLDSNQKNYFDHTHRQWLISFGEQVGLAIRNARYTTDLEAIVRERTQQIEFEQAQLRAILNGVTDGVVYTDLERNPQYINQSMIDITGFTEHEWLIGEAQITLNSHNETDISDQWQRILRWLESSSVWTDEYTLVRKDGSLFNAGISRTMVRNQFGNPVGVVTVVRDISDEKQLAEQKARFITKAAHELRTPIANLKTRMFLIKRRPDKMAEHLQVADSVINLMQNLVEHMFDLSRFERGIIELAREDFVLQPFLLDVIEYQRPQAQRMNIDFNLSQPDDPITIHADPYRMTQVITNLIGNALKYAETNKDIKIEVKALAEYVQIAVIDYGKGIEQEHLDKLFQPFYQVSENYTGVGLGLSIVQEIVYAHRGTIDVQSQLGEGTTFYIQLPLRHEQDLTGES